MMQIDDDVVLSNLDENMRFFEDLAYECPLGSLEDYARHNDFSQEVRDG